MENNSKAYKFPKDIGDKWLKALRSKKYKQGSGFLFIPNGGYCCLGVLGRICGLKEAELDQRHWLFAEKNSDDHSQIHLLTEKQIKKIPVEVVGYSNNNILVSKLSELNDSGKSFVEIADWIEENVEFYEK